MPTSTFMNLPDSKRQKIISAAIQEFSMYSFDKVSINRIIKEAGISRGSFYMYFQDIYDLALFLIQGIKQKIFSDSSIFKTQKEISLEEFILEYHGIVYDYYNQEVYRNMVKNILIYFQGRQEEELETLKGKMPQRDDIKRLLPYIAKNSFQDKSDENILNVLEMALATFREVMFISFIRKLDKEQSREVLIRKLEILKYGYKERQ